MKRTLFVLMLSLGAFALLLFSACDGGHSEHTYGEWVTTKEATCEEPGVRTRTCSCGDTQTEKIASKGHAFSTVFTTDVEPTCSTLGRRSKHCTREGCTATTAEETIPMKEHEYGDWVETPATCTSVGKNERKCKNCDHTESEEIPMISHNFTGGTQTKAPTCTEEGVMSGGTCSECGAPGEETPIPRLGHDFKGAEEVISQPTCTEPGSKTVQCTRCDVKDTEEINPKGHSWDDGVEENVTGDPCVTKIKKFTCTVCEATKKEDVESTHQWSAYVYYSGSICSANGLYEKRTCSVCNKDEIINTAKSGPHTESNLYYIEKEPTETSEGIRYKLCEMCGEVMKETRQTIPMLKGGNSTMTYTVRVCREGSARVDFDKEMTVEVYDGNKSVAKKTTKQFVAEFSLPAKEYTVKVSGCPDGFKSKTAGYTMTPARSDINAELTVSLLSKKKDKYEEGDVIHDFTFTDYDGNEYRVSEILKKYKIMVLDFYYTGCSHCDDDFDVEARYDVENRYKGQVFFVCVNTNGDSKSNVETHANKYKIQDFVFVNGKEDDNRENFLVPFFNSCGSGTPVKVIIDSNGVYRKFYGGETHGAALQVYEKLINNYEVYKDDKHIPTASIPSIIPGENDKDAE